MVLIQLPDWVNYFTALMGENQSEKEESEQWRYAQGARERQKAKQEQTRDQTKEGDRQYKKKKKKGDKKRMKH